MHPRSMRRGLAGLGVMLLVLALASPAFAHVDAEGSTDPTGTTTVTFSFEHGCGQSPTTGLRVQLPANASDVKAENPTGWTSNVADSVLTWSGGTPVANGTKAEFVATMKLSGNAGDTVFFPTVQSCTSGENAWIDKSDDAEAENAAPRIKLGATAPAGDHDAATGTTQAPTTTPATTVKATSTTAAAGTTAKATATPPASPESSNTGLIIGIVLAVLIVGGAVTALILRGRASR